MLKKIIILFIFTFVSAKSEKLDTRANLLFGLNQPLLSGFNIEANYFWDRLAFDYSHGVSLNFANETLGSEAKDQGLQAHVPWTTGFGVGYRINSWLNLRAEPKWHKFELSYDGGNYMGESVLFSYTTFSLGLGAYANIRPFKKWGKYWEGIMIAPSIRYWPRITSSLDDNKIQYQNTQTGQSETHNAMEVGIANTPWIFNISVGYSIEI